MLSNFFAETIKNIFLTYHLFLKEEGIMKSITNMIYETMVLAPLLKISWPQTRVFFWTLNSILLVFISVLNPLPHCLDYHYFVVGFEVSKCKVLLLFFFPKAVLAITGPQNSTMNFGINFSISIKPARIW